jgi:hypothetical protein
VLFRTDVNQSVEKRARGDDQRAAPVCIAILHGQTDQPAVFDE